MQKQPQKDPTCLLRHTRSAPEPRIQSPHLSSPTHGLSWRVYEPESGHGKLIVYAVPACITEISYPVSRTLHLGSVRPTPPVNGEFPDGACNCTVSSTFGCPSQDVETVACTTVPALAPAAASTFRRGAMSVGAELQPPAPICRPAVANLGQPPLRRRRDLPEPKVPRPPGNREATNVPDVNLLVF